MKIIILQNDDVSFLEKYLPKEQIIQLATNLLTGIPILITGKRTATGKSTVCDYLRKIGADVREDWELEEGSYKNECNNENMVYFNIALNKEL